MEKIFMYMYDNRLDVIKYIQIKDNLSDLLFQIIV